MKIRSHGVPITLLFMSLVPMLSGCGAGAADDTNEIIHTRDGSIISRSPLAVGSEQCPTGGATVNYGIDKNANGKLDNDEVNGSDTVCNGDSGLTALISTSDVTAGSDNCQAGGVRINIGLDKNRNNMLDNDETTSSSTVICHGANSENTTVSESDLEKLLSSATIKIAGSGSVITSGRKTENLVHGTGFFISENGYILTNNHVVTGLSDIEVYDANAISLGAASVVGVAECADLAVIKLANSTVKRKFLSWSDVPITRGLDTVAAGFPADVQDKFGNAQFTYTKGNVTSLPLLQGTPWGYVETYSHDAQIYQGNSGGPLVDFNTGKVVGINTMVTRFSDYSFGMPRFYAIPSNSAKPYAERLSKGENIQSIGSSSEVVFDDYGLPKGVYVKAVTAAGHAARAGIQPGDIISSLNAIDLFVRNDNDWSNENNRAKFSMEKYCGILASYPPNNPNGANDVGATLPIKVLRSEGAGQSCTGQINGTALTCSSGDNEPNNTYATAQTISVGQTINGVINNIDSRSAEWDGFKFVVTTTGNYRIRLSSNLVADLDVYVDTDTGGKTANVAKSATSGYSDEDFVVSLTSGTYYLWVRHYSVSPAVEYRLSISQ